MTGKHAGPKSDVQLIQEERGHNHVRLHVWLLAENAGLLRAAAARKGLTNTDVVNQSIALYDEWTREADRGSKWLLKRKGSSEILELSLGQEKTR